MLAREKGLKTSKRRP